MKDKLFNSGGSRCTDGHFTNDDLIGMDIGTDMIDFPHAAQRRLHSRRITQVADRSIHRA